MAGLVTLYRLSILAIGLTLALPNSALGAENQVKVSGQGEQIPLSLDVLPEDSYVLQGFQGRVRVIPDEGAQSLRVFVRPRQAESSSALMQRHQEEWGVSLERKSNVIQIEVQTPQSKDLWHEILAKESAAPHFDLEIRAPLRPLDVHWRRGEIEVRSWSAALSVFSHEAQTLIVGGQGVLNIHQQLGEVRVIQREGPLDLNTFSARVRLEKLSGDIRVDNFAGQTEIFENEGEIFLAGFEATQKVVGGRGRIEFKHQRSPLRVENFAGDLRGESEQGEVVASLRGEANVRVITKEAAVNLSLPGSGASVNLGSQEGAIDSPGFLRVDQMPHLRTARGRLRGGERGSVYVRTESGEIRLR